MFDEDPKEGLIDRAEYEVWSRRQELLQSHAKQLYFSRKRYLSARWLRRIQRHQNFRRIYWTIPVKTSAHPGAQRWAEGNRRREEAAPRRFAVL